MIIQNLSWFVKKKISSPNEINNEKQNLLLVVKVKKKKEKNYTVTVILVYILLLLLFSQLFLVHAIFII